MALIDGLVAYWKLDGDALDAHGANDGTFANASYAAGKINNGGVFAFNGNQAAAAWISVANTNFQVADFSFSAWAKTTANTGMIFEVWDQAANFYRGWELHVTAAGVAELITGHGAGTYQAYTGTTAINDGRLHHFWVTYDSATRALKLYLDGVLEISGTAPSAIQMSAAVKVRIGINEYQPGNFAEWFAGVIDEIGFWGVTKTPADGAAIYAAGAGLPYPLLGAPPTLTSVSPATGVATGGTALTLTGTDFVTGATVTVGGVAATSVVFVNSTSLTCVSPAGPLGAADVVVTNPDTQTGTLAAGFAYTAAPPDPLTVEAQTLIRLLPPGRVWNFEVGGSLRKVLLAIGDELARVRARGVDLINESDPRTASETLADWEEMLALPDDLVTAIPGTTAGRRVAIAAKYAARGGQSYSFFSTLCSACGYPLVSITLYAADFTRSGTLRSGDALSGTAWAYTMTVTVTAAASPPALTHAQLEAVVRKATHSHINVLFVYV